MYEIWILVFGMIGIPAGITGNVYLGLSVWAQIQNKATPKSSKYGIIGLWCVLICDISWVLYNTGRVYVIGATNSNLTWLFTSVVSLLVTVVLLHISD